MKYPTRRPQSSPVHDRTGKLLFSHARVIRDLLRGFVREEWTGELDLSTLEKAPGSFVGRGLTERHNDVLWRLRWTGGGWLYVLLELQSRPDPFMAVRLLTYSGLLLECVIRNEKSLSREEGLPAVLPVVIHTGRTSWRTPLDLAGLFPVPRAFEASLPRLSCRLLDVRRLDLERPDLSENLLATLFRIEASRSPEEIFQRIDDLNRLLPEDGEDELRRDITVWLQGKLQNAFPWVKMIPSVELEGSPMLEENMDIWRRWTERRARRQGREEGEQKGLKRGEVLTLKRTLLRLLEQRFGPVPPTVQRGVESMRSVQRLERMVDRVLIARSLHEMGLS